MQKVRWQTCNVLGFKQWKLGFQCFKRDQKSVAKLGKESRRMTTLPSGPHSCVYGGSPTGCPSAGVCQKPIMCFIWKGQSPHCAQRSHGHPADEQQTEAEKWSLNLWVPFTQMQSLCAVLSKDRMRRADTRPAGGLSETGGELSTAQRGHCSGWHCFCPESQAQSVCPQKWLHKLPCLPRHSLLTALSHPCFLFQSGSKAPSLLSTILNTLVNTQAMLSPSF